MRSAVPSALPSLTKDQGEPGPTVAKGLELAHRKAIRFVVTGNDDEGR